MPRLKILKSVAYSFAQHCQSGLSYLHPYISDKCKKHSLDNLCIQLYPEFNVDIEIKKDEPLFFALDAATKRFFEILRKNKFDSATIKLVQITFFTTNSDWNTKVCTKIETNEGTIFNECVNPI